MELDRQNLLVIVGAIVAMVLFSGYFFGPKSAAQREVHLFAPEDVRYKYQQADLKAKAKAKKNHHKPAPAAASESSDDGAGGDNEEPSLDHDAIEEPPLE